MASHACSTHNGVRGVVATSGCLACGTIPAPVLTSLLLPVLTRLPVQEVEKEVDEGEEGGGRKSGRKRKIEVLEYHYERDMEGGC